MFNKMIKLHLHGSYFKFRKKFSLTFMNKIDNLVNLMKLIFENSIID